MLAPPALEERSELPFCPCAPKTFEELGVSETVVTDIILRRTLMEGQSGVSALSQALRLSHPLVDQVFRQLRSQALVEVKGMAGNDYRFVLSAAGKQLATERMQVSQYAGPCPVSLRDYSAAVSAQAAKVSANREIMRRIFHDLVVPDDLLDQIGPAVIAQNSVFVYGPTGNGKTSIAERLTRVYRDTIKIPYAVEVDHQIVSVYDPVIHQSIGHPVPVKAPTSSVFLREEEPGTAAPEADTRWVTCARPFLVVGGELVPSMLELRLDELSGIYAAPLQMKANNGILVIDDFGRQLMSPRDLLNRWIVPLDRRVDYLSLRYGVKFQIPFEMMVVFSTNLDPSDLADEAFLRRIHHKVYVDAVSAANFDEILARVIKAKGLPAVPGAGPILREIVLSGGRTELKACYPGDICNIIVYLGRYEGREPAVDRDGLRKACAMYFARS